MKGEAAVGFEPTNKGFADLRLRPLYKNLAPITDFFSERFLFYNAI